MWSSYFVVCKLILAIFPIWAVAVYTAWKNLEENDEENTERFYSF